MNTSAFSNLLWPFLDPRALDAASRMCNGLWRLFLDQKRQESEIARFGRKKDGSAGAVGTDPFQLTLVPAQGNLREKLTWVLAAIRNGIAAELLSTAGLLHTPDRTIPHFHDPNKERLEEERKSVKKEEDRLTKQKPIEVQHPPLSHAEEKIAVGSDGKLHWVTGGRAIDYAMKTSYQMKAEKELRLVSAGPSGTAFAMLYVANQLGVNLLEARLALLTWMLTVGDHTFDEIMEGCSVWGQSNGKPELAYSNRSSVKRYRMIAPLTEYELRRFVCENDEFPDEVFTQRMLNEMETGTHKRFY